MEFGDVIVPLCLEEVASNWISEAVLCGKLGHGLTGATSTQRSEVEFATLFVQQEHVAM